MESPKGHSPAEKARRVHEENVMMASDPETPAKASSVEQYPWGQEGAHLFTVRNGDLEIVLSNYGATLLSVKFPDRSSSGRVASVLRMGRWGPG